MHLEHGKRSAEENVQMEKDRNVRHSQAMEAKLKDLQVGGCLLITFD